MSASAVTSRAVSASAVTTADVVVVGAGILGAATAFHLTRAGHRVVVLDRGAVNRQGSGATAGNIHVQALHSRRPGQATPLDARRLLPFQKAARAGWDAVESELGGGIELSTSGGLTVAEDDHQLAELQAKARWEAEIGIPTEILDARTARALEPALGPSVIAATWCALDGQANPLLVGPAYLRAALDRGARMQPNCAVIGLERCGTGWRVTTDTGLVIDAPVVVNVAGPELGEVCALAGVELLMRPVAIQMHATERTEPVLHHVVQHIGVGLSVKQVRAGNVLIGGGWPAASLGTTGRFRESVASLTGNVAQALRILPGLTHLQLLRSWAGPLGATPDELPVIGEVPGAPGLFVAGGTYAFTFAPLWAETLTALVDGRAAPVDLDGLRPDRLVRAPVPAGSNPDHP